MVVFIIEQYNAQRERIKKRERKTNGRNKSRPI